MLPERLAHPSTLSFDALWAFFQEEPNLEPLVLLVSPEKIAFEIGRYGG